MLQIVSRSAMLVCALLLGSVLQWRAAFGQSPAEFYRGKSVDLYIGTSVGGGYDAYGRMLARHLGRHMPGNPTIVRKWVNVLFQMGLSKHPDLPDAPLIMDLAGNEQDRAIFKLMFARQVIAWPYATPPGVPKDRVEVLRQAFADTMIDKDFLADAAKGNFEIRPVAGQDIQNLLAEVYDTPTAVAQKATRMLQ